LLLVLVALVIETVKEMASASGMEKQMGSEMASVPGMERLTDLETAAALLTLRL